MNNSEIRIDKNTLLNFTSPDIEHICVTDIARVLAKNPRYNGHGVGFKIISIAEHSVNVYLMVKKWLRRAGIPKHMLRQYYLSALFHDAHEYIIGDIPTPVKNAIGRDAIRSSVASLDAAFGEKFEFDATFMHGSSVKTADAEMLIAEGEWLFERNNFEYYTTFLQELAATRPIIHRIGFKRKPKIGLSPVEARDLFLECFYEIMA
jgi:5'-deoxynucleotidase YfbR-like HD superfamily hydrolase